MHFLGSIHRQVLAFKNSLMECNWLKRKMSKLTKKKSCNITVKDVWMASELWHLKTISGSVRILAFFASLHHCLPRDGLQHLSSGEESVRDQIFTPVNTLPSTHTLCKLHLKPAEWNVYKSFSGTSLVQDLSISFLVPVPHCWMGELMNRPGRTEKREFEVLFTTRLCARSNRMPLAGVERAG